MQLRYYQEEAVQSVFDYFTHKRGNPVIVLPTGGGKSLTMAALIKRAITQYPSTNILLLAHVKELLEQNTYAIIRHWPEAPVGIWSAGLRQKTKAQVTVAGIQSIYKHPAKFAETDLIIIDEAHLLSHKSETTYRRFIDALLKYNPSLKVIGLTATPYRTDSGLITEGDNRLFTDVCYEIGVGKLIQESYLCPLVSKGGNTQADLSGVHTRGGEFIPGELAAAMDKAELINGALDEIEILAADRHHILGFCAGIEHSAHFAELARARGHTAGYVSGEMGMAERDRVIRDFKEGRIRFLFNAAVLTTGFDFPGIDCIVMARPTKSTGLYYQILGRGLRKAPTKENTLVLDFAGNVKRHGPIDMIRVKSKRAKGEDAVSVAPVKECPSCQELLHTSIMECPSCGHLFERSAPHGVQADDTPVVAVLAQPRVVPVDRVIYSLHQKDGKPATMLVKYVCGLHDYKEWLPIEDPRSHVRKHAVKWFWDRGLMCPNTVDEALKMADAGGIPAPVSVTVKLDGKYFRVIHAEIDWKKGVAA